MSLVFSLKKGHDFYVGPLRFIVEAVHKGVDFTIRDEQTGKVHEVTDAKAVEITEDVFVSAGKRQQSSTARVTIDAPEELLILRGQKYRETDEPAHEIA